MRIRPLLLGVAVACLSTARPASAADDDAALPKLMEAKAPAVVMVKSVLKISFEGGGGDRERNDERNGVVVDAAGVVMIQNFLGTQATSRFKVSPTNIRVLFDGDEKEYDAILGAMDSKLGLGFVRVKDLAGKTLSSANLADGAEAKLGDEVFGVLRTDQGFDYAPYFGVARLVGQVTKPRTMWILAGFTPVGHPLYSRDGKVAGVVVRQSGITEEGTSERTFLLPAKAVSGVVAQAVKASAKALEDAKTHEAEAAAAMAEPAMGDAPPAMGEPGMEEPGMAEPGMGDAVPGMTDAPPGMDA